MFSDLWTAQILRHELPAAGGHRSSTDDLIWVRVSRLFQEWPRVHRLFAPFFLMARCRTAGPSKTCYEAYRSFTVHRSVTRQELGIRVLGLTVFISGRRCTLFCVWSGPERLPRPVRKSLVSDRTSFFCPAIE